MRCMHSNPTKTFHIYDNLRDSISTLNSSINILVCLLFQIHFLTSNFLLQLCPQQTSCLPLYEVKWGLFDRPKSTFKMLLTSWYLDTILNGIRSSNSENMKSVGHWAAKFQAIKLWEWFNPRRSRMWAEWFEWGPGLPADFF